LIAPVFRPMNPPEPTPPLRLADAETPEQLARHHEREQRAVDRQRELDLEHSLAPFRVGSVPHLNTVPLTRGIEDQIRYAPPAQLAELLRREELDAALLSITEALGSDRYDVLDGLAIASLGEVRSVLLAHRRPLDEMTEVFCDPASLTSVSLLRVLLHERGLQPDFRPLIDYWDAINKDFVLLIGDRALDFVFGPHDHEVWDLGAAWTEMTHLPFVYAGWVLRRGVENQRLRRLLREAKDFGLDTLDHIIASRSEYTLDFRKDYFNWHIHYHLGEDEKRGVAKFAELLRKLDRGPVYEPVYVR
jgi:chorismate dehydratase